MTPMNRAFQETLFESILSFNSDDFKRLVVDLHNYPDNLVNDFLFAENNFYTTQSIKLAIDALIHPKTIIGPNILKSISRLLSNVR